MKIFAASEVFQFAIRIEENGEKFYRRVNSMTKDAEEKVIFNYLADEELNHKRVFEDLLTKIEKYEPAESYPGEYFAYLRAYVDNIIFNKEVQDEELAEVKDTLSAVKFAVQRELDSILYYHEVKKFVPEGEHHLINKIVDEEREHFVKLLGLEKSIKEKG
ncbi:ferritin family protein [bacterium]|nr:ferritin family protein [bacterium]MCK4325207.1 ferritin family protein [bacterium]MCK4437256.1 ferritin family protein [bacterium]